MAYVKQWAPRSFRPLELRMPELLAGDGRAVRGDALRGRGSTLGEFDLAYLDPPYNQHRYFTNYHVWETLVAWDAPEHYGVACKRVDARDPSTEERVQRAARDARRASSRRARRARAGAGAVVQRRVVGRRSTSCETMCAVRGAVEVLEFDSKRYVGAQIGIHNPSGERVGTVSHVRNREYVLIVGERREVRRLAAAAREEVPHG